MFVSIILPTYNRSATLKRSVNSILNQTYRDFELIIVDDGSSDDTENLVRTFTDKRIVYVRNRTQKGVSIVRNQGLAVSNGEYLSFIDSDDIWFSKKLKIEVDALASKDQSFGAVYCAGVISKGEKRKIIRYHDIGSGDLSDKILYKWPPLEAALFRKSCLDKLNGFDPKIGCGEDIDFLIRFCQLYKMHYVDVALFMIYETSTSLSRNWFSDLHGRETRLKKYPEIYQRNPAAFSKENLYIGLCYSSLKSMENCRKHLIKGKNADPLAFKCYIAFLLSLFGINALEYFMRITNWAKSIVINNE